MIELLACLRALQLFTHHAHNLCARTVFLQDHDFFGSVYPEAESDYDSLIERIIGTKGEVSELELNSLMSAVMSKLSGAPSVGQKENKAFFVHQLKMEQTICSYVESLCKSGGLSQGQIQLLGDIAQRSEIRQYKIKQRCK
jgi:DNA-binding ferritin-like protein